MTTLVIHAPYQKGKPGAPNSFETYLKTGVGKGYAISQKDVNILSAGSKVVLLRQDKNVQRAEELLVELKKTNQKTPQGIQRYDVYFEKQMVVAFKREKLNHFGVTVY